jgi:cytochrome c553
MLGRTRQRPVRHVTATRASPPQRTPHHWRRSPLSNDDVRDLGAYFASLTAADPTTTNGPDDHPDLTDTGKKAAAAGRCASCHGDNYTGSKAVARIAGQREDYLVKALHDYKAGVRSGGGVAVMAEVAYPLSDQDIAALAHYLARL